MIAKKGKKVAAAEFWCGTKPPRPLQSHVLPPLHFVSQLSFSALSLEYEMQRDPSRVFNSSYGFKLRTILSIVPPSKTDSNLMDGKTG